MTHTGLKDVQSKYQICFPVQGKITFATTHSSIGLNLLRLTRAFYSMFIVLLVEEWTCTVAAGCALTSCTFAHSNVFPVFPTHQKNPPLHQLKYMNSGQYFIKLTIFLLLTL